MEGDEQRARAQAQSIDEWITRLRLIPEEQRRFEVDARQAKLEFGIDVTLARQLDLPRIASQDERRRSALHGY